MASFAVSQLSDQALLREFGNYVQQDRANTAALLAHLGEIDARGLFRPAGYPSMFAYLVGAWHMSEESAYKRIRAARAARDCPAILDALADGRLNLSEVVLLASKMTRDTADELLKSAANKSKSEIELLLARQFPQPDVATTVRAIPPSPSVCQLSPGTVLLSAAELGPRPESPVGGAAPPAPEARRVLPLPAAPLNSPLRIAPLAPQRFAIQVTVDQETHDLLRYAQSLLGHAVPAGDISQVVASCPSRNT